MEDIWVTILMMETSCPPWWSVLVALFKRGEGEGSGGVMTHDGQFSGQPSHVTAIPCMQPLVRTNRLIDHPNDGNFLRLTAFSTSLPQASRLSNKAFRWALTKIYQ